MPSITSLVDSVFNRSSQKIMQCRPSTPFLSVVTPTKNARRFLENCLAAVRRVRASGISVEHIFIDGGSDDGTLDILRSRSDVVVYCEPNLDIVESIARGIDHCSGEFVTTLMADDELTNGFAKFAQSVAESPDSVDFALAPCLLVPEDKRATVRTLAAPISLWNILSGYPGLNSCIFRRSLWSSDNIPRSYSHTNDRLLILRLLGRSRMLLVGTTPIGAMQVHDGSRTLGSTRNVQEIKRELNGLAHELVTLNKGHAFEPVLALWAWRTALSLAKERISLGPKARVKIIWPRFTTLARIPVGLLSIILGHDRIYQPIGEGADFCAVSTNFRSLSSG